MIPACEAGCCDRESVAKRREVGQHRNAVHVSDPRSHIAGPEPGTKKTREASIGVESRPPEAAMLESHDWPTRGIAASNVLPPVGNHPDFPPVGRQSFEMT